MIRKTLIKILSLLESLGLQLYYDAANLRRRITICSDCGRSISESPCTGYEEKEVKQKP